MLIDLKIFENMPSVERVFKGGYVCGLNTASHVLGGAVGRGNYDFNRTYFGVGGINSYGVIDTPKQFQEKFGKLLEDDARQFAVFFTHIAQDSENKGYGGGWRWHKWGEYLGDGKPQCEYLDDEDDFVDGVYVFHIYIVDGVDSNCVCFFDAVFKDYHMRFPFQTVDAALEDRASMLERVKELDDKPGDTVIGEIVFLKNL